uniref:Uncharacterized protein n=1 Tax=Candidatus Kentrum sp. DK TaxID=2126562 RepID=A0A450SNM5_9GAMM|nr:MAG: Protein of unknown function (DUF2934) [Candidatus Kentron sp. DK]
MEDVSGNFIARSMVRKTRPVSGIGKAENGKRTDIIAAHPRVANGSRAISPEERWQAIAVMAYHLARTRGFVGNTVKYWLAAEKKVDAELAIQQSPM